ncbi:uncharacterized protein MYCFIDRAFT_199435 [Pseudocercospora fijiensis CIRAD86]|uniref:Uncharacterized protein n=1 Tax=Pseudocercospora fijiensis (strain CIRAD86) TaxID=383855 RepID=M2ZL46_PSEFD|nr:uncharacterized protein MYCFIDRAFT_199435 [Pseudocercospora fijiensis CIRAD86]EME79774.1 hypothetical protein MYCFIDRAFT_199435 [Pseudocercospora fijiensis CIRAD86]
MARCKRNGLLTLVNTAVPGLKGSLKAVEKAAESLDMSAARGRAVPNQLERRKLADATRLHHRSGSRATAFLPGTALASLSGSGSREQSLSPHFTMCFQGWANYACGHTKAFEQTCAYADDLDVTFWLKVACPWYSNTSRQLDFKCGKHKYYCGHSEDGAYLEKVHLKRDKAEEKFNELHDQMHNHWSGLLKTKWEAHKERGGTKEEWVLPMPHASKHSHFASSSTIAHRYITHVKERSLTPFRYMSHPSVKKVQEIMTNLDSQKNEARRDMEKCDYIINETKRFYQLYGNQSIMSTPTHTGMPMAAAFSIGAESQAIAGAPLPQMASAANTLYQAGLAKPPANLGMMAGSSHNQPQAGGIQYGNILGPAPHRLGGLYNPAMANMTSGPLQNYAQAPNHPSLPQYSPPKKRGRGKKKTEEEPPKKESESVRRSTRVRGKKINYAEELTDVSRSPSPEKSDASAFTPSKSDASGSPAKSKNARQSISRTRNLQQGLHSRGSPSLLDKIGEWKRQDSSFNTPSPPKRSFSQQYSQMPSGRPGSPLKNENLRAGYLDTPGTMQTQPWSTQVPTGPQGQAHAGAQSGMYPTHAQRNWVVDRNGSNPMLSAAMAISGMLQPRPQQESQQPMPSYNYQRMHQALHTSSQARLLAPSAQHLGTNSPMKRTVSAPEQNVAPMLAPTLAVEAIQAEPSSDIDWNLHSGDGSFQQENKVLGSRSGREVLG